MKATEVGMSRFSLSFFLFTSQLETLPVFWKSISIHVISDLLVIPPASHITERKKKKDHIEFNKRNNMNSLKESYLSSKGNCLSILTHIYGIQKDGNNNLVYKTAKETLMYRTVLWTLWERERVGRFGRMALKHVKYHV